MSLKALKLDIPTLTYGLNTMPSSDKSKHVTLLFTSDE